MSASERALEAVRVSAGARRDEALARWNLTAASDRAADPDVMGELATSGRLTVNFHPDRIARSGVTVAEGMVRTGRYVSQWVTGISNGGRSAFPGGDRHRWERTLFAQAYEDADPASVEFPVYGAWDLLRDPHGGSPRFGSCFLVLADHVRERATICVGDSHAGPTDMGTFDSPSCVLAALAEQADRGSLLGAPVDGRGLLGLLDGAPAKRRPCRDLDHYIEMQVHGGVDLRSDVDTIVLDPSFRFTDVNSAVAELSDRYDVEVAWHAGSELSVDQIPTDFRGPTMPGVGRRAARSDGIVDAHSIGVAARAVRLADMQASGDPPESDAQQLKYLWHTLLAHGADAEQRTA
jgi:hypothetical protein